jgi:mannosyltransferase
LNTAVASGGKSVRAFPSLAFVATALSTWWILVAAITCLALALRVIGLDRKSVWFDEALGFEAARLPLAELWRSVGAERNPPFYFFLQHYWLLAKPPGDGWLRLPAAIAGSGAVAVSMVFARGVLGQGWAAVAGLLIAVSPFAIDMSQEARPYGLFFLCAATSILCLGRVLTHGSRWWCIGYIVATTLALYTHNYAVFLVLAHATSGVIWMLMTRRLQWPAMMSFVVAGLLFTPWLGHLAGQVQLVGAGFWIDAPGPSTFWDTYQAFLVYSPIDHGAGTNLILKGHRWLGIALLAAAATFLPRCKAAALAAVAFGVPIAAAIAVSFVIPIYTVRYVSFVIGAFWILLVCGLSVMPGQYVRFALAVLAVLGVLVNVPALYLDPFYNRSDLRGAASSVRAGWRPGDLIVHTTQFAAVTFDYYNAGQQPQVLLSEPDPNGLCSVSVGHTRLWIVRDYGLADSAQATAAHAVLAEYAGSYPVVLSTDLLGVAMLLVHVPNTGLCPA